MPDRRSEVELRFVEIVSAASKLDGGNRRLAARRIRRRVMELEESTFLAASPARGDEGALATIARPDGPAHGRRHMS